MTETQVSDARSATRTRPRAAPRTRSSARGTPTRPTTGRPAALDRVAGRRPRPAGRQPAGGERLRRRASAAVGRTAARPRRPAPTAGRPGSGAAPTAPERRPRACRPAAHRPASAAATAPAAGANGAHGSTPATGARTRAADGRPRPYAAGHSPLGDAPTAAAGAGRAPTARGPDRARRGDPRPRAGPSPSAAARPARRARLRVKRIDPWSVMKFSFALSLALFFVVARRHRRCSTACWTRWASSSRSTSLYDEVIRQRRHDAAVHRPALVLGGAALLGAVNVVLFTRAGDARRVRLQLCCRPGRRHRGHARRED